MMNWVLFGTGALMGRHKSILDAMGLDVTEACDNDRKKWGARIGGLPVVSPGNLCPGEQKVLISCDAVPEIKSQLYEIGFSSDDVYDRISILGLYSDWVAQNKSLSEANVRSIGSNSTVIFDTYDGVGWGGMEIWSYMVADGLRKRGHNVCIYGAYEQTAQPEWENLICRFIYDHENETSDWSEVENIYDDMKSKLPFVLINNWSAQVMCAGAAIKKNYPDKIRIITMVHNDEVRLLEKVNLFSKYSDIICCVSSRIRNRLMGKFDIPAEKLLFHSNFVTGKIKAHGAARNNGSLKLCWAGRLERIQKRADLLPRLIEALDDSDMDYEFFIAGDGDWYEPVKKWVVDNHKEDHVKMCGYLDQEEMKGFWGGKHIYVNLSEYEGQSLVMIEAMANGVVPVVTDVSGTDELVFDGENGYLIRQGDLSGMAGRIAYLFKHEEKRIDFSERCIEMVKKNCDFGEYIKFVEALI